MTGTEILEHARKCITGERHENYGESERNFDKIAQFWTVYLAERLRKPISPEDVGLMMAFLKVARCMTGVQTEDSYVDACGYLALSGEIALKGGSAVDQVSHE